jgi:hypothetical protein
MLVAAIDALATLFIGRVGHFWAAGGVAAEGERNQHQRDREAEAGAGLTGIAASFRPPST